MRTRASRPRGRAQRRKLVWSTLNATVVLTSASDFQTVDLLGPLRAAGASVLGCTPMRTIINIYETTAVTVADTLSVGLIVQDRNFIGHAVTGGATPNNAVELDWAWIDTRTATKAANFPTFSNVNDSQWIHYDVKARRKVEELGDTWCLVVNPGSTATVPVNYNIFTRTLVALP